MLGSWCILQQTFIIILFQFNFPDKLWFKELVGHFSKNMNPLLYCHKISREETFAIFGNGLLIREIKFPQNIFLSSIRDIKFPRKKSFSLQFHEIFLRKVVQACLGR